MLEMYNLMLVSVECVGTFLGSYRLEKRSKSHGVSENSITIGIPIQMVIRWCLPFRLRLGPRRSFARKTTYRKNYLELGGPVEMGDRRRRLPGCSMISKPVSNYKVV